MGEETQPLNPDLVEEVEGFLDHLAFARGASPATVVAYRGDLLRAAQLATQRGVHRWPNLAQQDLLWLETALATGVARRTGQRRLSALRSFLKRLKVQGRGPACDLPSVGGGRAPKALPKALPLETLEKVLDVPDLAKPNGLRDRAFLELVYGAGLRVSEAVALTFDALDLENAAVRVTGKRGKTRWVPLPSQTVDWLRRYLRDGRPNLAKGAADEVILTDRGKPMLRQNAYGMVAACARRAGLAQGVGVHTLRHTYAVHLLKGGADLRAVQELLGHESIATTQVYTQLDLDEVKTRYRQAHPRR